MKTMTEKTKNIFLIILSVLMVFSIGISAFLTWQNYQLKQQVTNLTVDWKIYDKKYPDFEFKYPQYFREEPMKLYGPEQEWGQSFENRYNLIFGSMTNYNQETGKPYVNLEEFFKIDNVVKEIEVDGQRGIQVKPRAGSENVNAVYFFSKNKKTIYVMELTTYISDYVSDKTRVNETDMPKIQEGQKLFDQILSTFKFLD